ncbi:MAG: AAA family ATPase [Candidatus Binatia bacterium]
MARSDLLLTLVRSGSSGDRALFRKTVEALIAEERAQQHHVLADNLAKYLENGSLSKTTYLSNGEPPQSLFYEVTPRKQLLDLILPSVVQQACHELVEEHHRVELLRSYNLEPRNRILLTGPPGNGKTSLAEAIAESLLVPLIVVRYDGIIGSFLGETASRLRKLFDYVRTRRCVLFFDEFDTLGKERGDPHDTGEVKRVVSSLLLQIDDLPSHIVVVTATNHPELLDRAVWRRFQLRLQLPKPSRSQVQQWFEALQKRIEFTLGYSISTLADRLSGASFSELEEFSNDILRRWVLAAPNAEAKKIIRDRLEQWNSRFTPERQ